MAKQHMLTKKDVQGLFGIQTKEVKGFLDVQTKKVEGLLDTQTKKVEGLLDTQTKKVEGLLDVQTKKVEGFLDTHLKGVKGLLGEQTVIILNAVDEKIQALDLKFTEKFDQIMTLLDKYSGRTTTLETEFTIMQHDVNRMKKIIKEKLGVEW